MSKQCNNNRCSNNNRCGNSNYNNYQDMEPKNAPITYVNSEKMKREVTIKFLKPSGDETKKYIPLYDSH